MALYYIMIREISQGGSKRAHRDTSQWTVRGCAAKGPGRISHNNGTPPTARLETATANAKQEVPLLAAARDKPVAIGRCVISATS